MHFWIQMEYCETNLSEFVAAKRKKKLALSESFLWDCFHQIALGLHHVHKGNLIHLDIKPENVLVNTGEEEARSKSSWFSTKKAQPVYKLGDFGQARLKGHWQDGCEGDSQYIAPEIFDQDHEPTMAADIFSMGLLMFELSTSLKLPKSGTLWHQLRAGPKSPELMKSVANLGPVLRQLIVQCLDPNPKGRPSAREVAEVTKKQLSR
jgi:serine/threonine protein kinase